MIVSSAVLLVVYSNEKKTKRKELKEIQKNFFLIFFYVKLIRARDLFISKLLLCMRDGREFENSTRNEIKKKQLFSWGKKIANKIFISHFQKLHVVLIVLVCQLRLSVLQALCV